MKIIFRYARVQLTLFLFPLCGGKLKHPHIFAKKPLSILKKYRKIISYLGGSGFHWVLKPANSLVWNTTILDFTRDHI